MAKHAAAMKTCRILINTPSSQGGIGDLYNFKLVPSLTLGCGSWGGNSVSENVARTDFESHVIPNVVTYSGMAAALAFSLLLPYTRPALAAPGNPDFGTLLTERLVTYNLYSCIVVVIIA